MPLRQYIKKENCRLLTEKSKTDVLNSMMEDLHKKGFIQDLAELKKEIFYREELMSTGLGLGIAIPHVRFSGITDPVVSLGIQPRGIVDYQSLDNEPIKIIILIIVGKDQHKEHLQILSQIMARLKDQSSREKLILANTDSEIYEIITRGVEQI